MENHPIRKPAAGALVMALLPFIAMCFTVSLWDRVEPMVLGMPFNLFWLMLWIVLTSGCMWVAYRIERRKEGRSE